MLKLAIAGVGGKMGGRILALASNDKEVEGVEVFESPSHALTGKKIPFRSSEIEVFDSADKPLALCDVLIDFTSPDATLKNLDVAVSLKKPVVVGTTGFDSEGKKKISEVASVIPVVFSPNMSVGVNLLFRLVEIAARTLDARGYDTEIVELHHNLKKDSPSGTAAKLAEIVQQVSSGYGKKNILYGGRGQGITGPRRPNEIGVHAVRAGDIVGEHTVYFVSNGERLELTHRAHSRDCFASGAIAAAKWLVAKTGVPGLYSMWDVLGI